MNNGFVPNIGRSAGVCAGIGVVGVVLLGCAFDVVQVKQVPMRFESSARGPSFVLERDVKAGLGTSYPTLLRGGTLWKSIGASDHGDVFSTRDQVVTVEASHIHEADLVVSNRVLTGFRLKREGTFAPVTRPVALPLRFVP